MDTHWSNTLGINDYVLSINGETSDSEQGEAVFTGPNVVGKVLAVDATQENRYSVSFPKGVSVCLSQAALRDGSAYQAVATEHGIPILTVEPFTVICLYPEYATNDFGGALYVNVAAAANPYAAARQVREMAKQANRGEIPAEDFRIIAIIRGEVQLELDASDFAD